MPGLTEFWLTSLILNVINIGTLFGFVSYLRKSKIKAWSLVVFIALCNIIHYTSAYFYLQ